MKDDMSEITDEEAKIATVICIVAICGFCALIAIL